MNIHDMLITFLSSVRQSIQDLINDLYWKEGLTQEKIAKKLELPRELIIELMKKLEVSKRPNYEYIASLKGINHPQYGKKWEDLYGFEGAKKRKKEMSLISRKRIIKRLENNEMPFFNTNIEKKIANELIKRKIPFIQQYPLNNKFVCDFAILQFKIIIECDGDYWHSNPLIYNINNLDKRQKNNLNRDKFKDLYLTKNGWKVFRFFESEINHSVKDCVDKVENYLKDQLKNIKNPLDDL